MSAGEYYGNSWPFGLLDFSGILGQCGPLGQLSQIGALGDLRNKTATEQRLHDAALTSRVQDWGLGREASQSLSFDQRWPKRQWPGDVQTYQRPSQEDFESQMREALRNAEFRPPISRTEWPNEYTEKLGSIIDRAKEESRPFNRLRRFASWLRSKWPPAFWLRWKQNRAWKRRQREYDEQVVNAIVSGLTAR